MLKFINICFLLTLGFAADEPKWFPDLGCHPGAKKLMVDAYRKLAAECNNLDDNDPCLRDCVFEKWSLYTGETTFCPHKLAGFFNFLALNMRPNEYLSQKGDELRGCQGDSYRDAVFKGEKLPKSKWWCQSPVFDCMEAVLNCSSKPRDADEYGRVRGSYMILNVTCHPDYQSIPFPSLLLNQHHAENFCRMLFKDNVCKMVCATHGYPSTLHGTNPFAEEMHRYMEAAKGDDPEKIEDAIKRLQDLVVGDDPQFWFSPAERKEQRKNMSTEVATKIISNCLDLWKNTMELNWENCEDEQDKWEPLVDCLDNVFKCKV